MIPEPGFAPNLLAAFAGGFFGFVFAYLLALIQRKWDVDRARRNTRETQIQSVAVPLKSIGGQIRNEYRLDAYFNRATEDQVMRQIREAIYALNDHALAEMLEMALRPLHEFAGATTNPKEWGDKCLLHIEKMLGRLDEISRLK